MLSKIVEQKRREVEQLYERTSIADLEKQIADLPACLSLKQRFLQRRRKVGVIAEVKKASPSRGLIREPFDPLAIAHAYKEAGAEGISVLTDEVFFQGSLDFLRQIKQTLTKPIPLLRKDFMIDPLQLYEARAYGADVVLLIAAILDREQLYTLANEARSLGLETLVEVHTAKELDTVLDTIEPDLLGINNRDLKTFQTTLTTTFTLLEQLPDSFVTISESGIHSPEQIAQLAEANIDGVLVGEHFMRQAEIESAVYDLVGPIRSTEEARS
ncbi:indole-3-glycerol phosphate synthase TrpC [Aneurinibacillus sp. UBA3580]|jgi:indole-3-glycerol phosphate synthase|uniref:indole-3-glycerol phosphate synthase TrpC n=1 Tax=Aneurinibacillus sp. UBA3580 TaxID=1946041 RepID=UPI00257EDCE1|nr:indole-3-glycerol phosphate synthase TrpC [Aneurinibacillus sp. UBA3580]